MSFGRVALTVVRELRAASSGDKTSGPAAPRAKEYNQIKQRLLLVSLTVTLTGGAFFVASGLSRKLSDQVDRLTDNVWLRRSLFAVILGVIESALTLPISYYSGFVVEHRYGLSNQSRLSWTIDLLKGSLLAIPFAAFTANLTLELIQRWPKRWWAVATSLALPFTVLLSQLSPVLIMPIFNKFEPLKDRELAARLKELAARSGVNVASVMQMDMSRQTNKANAFFTGLGRTKRIVLADTMLDSFSPHEIEVVVAHEIAHQAHRDLWRFIALGTFFTAAVAWTLDRLARNVIERFGNQIGITELSDVAALPLLSWLLSFLGLALAPLQNAYSRYIERRADTFALRLTNDPSSFEAAMRRLADMNLSDPNPSAFVRYTMYSHPPIAQRIERARRFAREGE